MERKIISRSETEIEARKEDEWTKGKKRKKFKEEKLVWGKKGKKSKK